MSRNDPVIDRDNPRPLIDRKSSTRAQGGMPNLDPSKNVPAIPPGSHKTAAAPPTASKNPAAPSSTVSRPSSTTARSSLASSKLTTPTAASAARSINAPVPAPAPFGSLAPRLPSHMPSTGRVPRPVTMSEEAETTVTLSPSPSTRSLPRSPPEPSLSAPNVTASASESRMGTPLSKPTVSEESDVSSRSSNREDGNVTAEEPQNMGESITAAFSRPRGESSPQEAPRFFTGFGRSIDLYQEDLYEAVERYHGAYDALSSEDDPLAEYGAVYGIIPQQDHAACLALRDALIRYRKPHRSFAWTNLSDLIKEIEGFPAETVRLIPTVDSVTHAKCWSLNLLQLASVAHAVVGIQQILDALTIFLHKDPITSFSLDPGFGFLSLLESGEEILDLRFALECLQLRLVRADKHIALYLQRIKATLTSTDLSDQVSSVNSTISEVRREFGTEPPIKELYRLIQREDYSQRVALINSERRNHVLNVLNEPPRARYYKPRTRTAVPTRREPSPAPGASASQYAAPPQNAAPSWKTSASAGATPTVGPGVRFASTNQSSPPPSLSAVHSLPGMGRIPDTRPFASSTYNGGPSMMRGSSSLNGTIPIQVTKGYTTEAPDAGPDAGRVPGPNQSWTSHVYNNQQGTAAATITITPATDAGGSAPPPGDPFPAQQGLPPAWRGNVPFLPNSGGGGGGGDGDAGGSGGGNGGGGGGGNGDGGGPGGGGGGGDGNDPLAAPGQYPASAPDQWQLNPKLNISILPAWDGKGDTVIDYVIAMAYLAVLSPRMAQGIAQLAPSKFTGRAERWWTTLPLDRRAEFSMDWDHLLDAIRRQFLTAQWLFERTREFEEAHFRQKGHSDEEPLDFFQRRVRWHAFLFSDVADGPPAIARIIRTQPVEWFKDVNERVCPDIDTLMNYAEHNKASLLSAWVLAHRVEALMSGPSASTHAAPFRRRRAETLTAGLYVKYALYRTGISKSYMQHTTLTTHYNLRAGSGF
ncbi:hypothetical protein B0H12DRAFT_1239517 [Mycena haematopus]|nr:hypothetical protein B0H12DRAFT_1239517 [Mycena haematopus]